MKFNIIDELNSSLDFLELAIFNARQTLFKKKEISKDLYEYRLNKYDEMLNQQRELSSEIEVYLKSPDTDKTASFQVQRRVNIINGLSAMIKEDVQCLTKELLHKRREND